MFFRYLKKITYHYKVTKMTSDFCDFFVFGYHLDHK